YGIIDGGEHGFDRPVVWLAILGGLAVLGWFVRHELRSDHPSLDVRLFRMPRFAAPVALVGLVFFAAMGVMFFSSFYLQLVRGYRPLETGLLFLPFAAAQLIFAPRSAAMVRRYGGRAVAAVGLALTVAALGAFAFIDASTPIWVVLVFFFLQGAGMANIMPPATESIMSALPREKAGVGSAVSNTVRQVAGALGVAVLGSVLSAVYRNDVASALAGLPAPAREAADESLSGAYAAAARLGPAGPKLIAAANDSFVSAMHWAAALSAVVATLGILIVLRWMPGRPTAAPAPARPEVEP
ncbi:MFS transporter, partial [Micromonospora mangrovi]